MIHDHLLVKMLHASERTPVWRVCRQVEVVNGRIVSMNSLTGFAYALNSWKVTDTLDIPPNVFAKGEKACIAYSEAYDKASSGTMSYSVTSVNPIINIPMTTTNTKAATPVKVDPKKQPFKPIFNFKDRRMLVVAWEVRDNWVVLDRIELDEKGIPIKALVKNGEYKVSRDQLGRLNGATWYMEVLPWDRDKHYEEIIKIAKAFRRTQENPDAAAATMAARDAAERAERAAPAESFIAGFEFYPKLNYSDEDYVKYVEKLEEADEDDAELRDPGIMVMLAEVQIGEDNDTESAQRWLVFEEYELSTDDTSDGTARMQDGWQSVSVEGDDDATYSGWLGADVFNDLRILVWYEVPMELTQKDDEDIIKWAKAKYAKESKRSSAPHQHSQGGSHKPNDADRKKDGKPSRDTADTRYGYRRKTLDDLLR